MCACVCVTSLTADLCQIKIKMQLFWCELYTILTCMLCKQFHNPLTAVYAGSVLTLPVSLSVLLASCCVLQIDVIS